jgi:hypothetical protein
LLRSHDRHPHPYTPHEQIALARQSASPECSWLAGWLAGQLAGWLID